MKNISNVLRFNPITNKIDIPILNLETKSGEYIGTLKYENFSASFIGNGIDEISFDVRKKINGEINDIWESIVDLKTVEYVGYGKFEINVSLSDKEDTIKTIIGKSLEVELGQKYIRELHINDDEDILKDNYSPTYIYDADDANHSLLNRVIKDKAPDWSIGYVSDLLCVNNKVYPTNTYQRTFTVNNSSIYDFLTGDLCSECNCIIIFNTTDKKINLYNIKDYVYKLDTMEVVDGGYKNNGTLYNSDGTILSDSDYGFCCGIGKDTFLYADKTMLANELSIDDNMDNVKNCFYVSGGDETITNYVPVATMTGNNYIYIFDKFQKEDMPELLTSALDNYKKIYEDSKEIYYGSGGVYVYDSMCHYDALTKTCRNSNNKILSDAIYNNNKIYVLDTCAYYKNGVAYSRDNNVIPNENYYYTSDGGYFTKYCNALNRLNYIQNDKFPDVSEVDTTAQDVANGIYDYFSNTNNKVYLKVSWTNNSFNTVTNTVETMLNVKCDSRYKLSITKSDTTPDCTSANSNIGTWSGEITVTSETDSADTYKKNINVCVMLINENVASQIDLWNKQKLEIAISKQDIANLDLSSYTTSSQLVTYFNQYNQSSLDSYCKCFSSCLNTLNDLYSSISSLSSVYSQLKTKYQLYYDSCKSVLDSANDEISKLNSYVSSLSQTIIDFQNSMSLKNYLDNIDDDLYPIFMSYVREEEYTNENYISDGLNDSECIKKAQELVSIAEDNLKKSCVLQKTISGDFNNIFANKKIKDKIDFSLFNYIRCSIDEKIYKLRLVQIDFNDSDLSKINVIFSEDVIDIDNSTDDIKSILQQASSISTSYQSTVQQAQQGTSAMSEINRLRKDGLSSSEYVISNSDNEEVVQDRNGILLRSMTDVGAYGDHQMRINGNGMYLTDSSWDELPRMAIGLVKLNGEWKYGVVADEIVGKLIAGEKMEISNANGSVNITGDGITFSNGAISQDAVNGLVNKLNEINGVAYDAKSDAQKISNGIGLTEIGSNYVISPIIAGGELLIGNESGTYAKIASDGKLYATNAEISGKIVATSGEINGNLIAKQSITANEINMSSLTGDSAFINAITSNKVIVNGVADNINVGGTNLLLDSAKTGGFKFWTPSPISHTDTFVDCADVSSGKARKIVYNQECSKGGVYFQKKINGYFKTGEYMTISLKVKSSNPFTIRIQKERFSMTPYTSPDTELVANKWTTLTLTGVCNEDMNFSTASTINSIFNLFPSTAIPAGTELLIADLKVERGNKATDWSPAPSDISVDNIYKSGTTTIDGGKIATNSITADRLNVTDLSALGATIGGWNISNESINKDVADGTITYNTMIRSPQLNNIGAGVFQIRKTQNGKPVEYPFVVNGRGEVSMVTPVYSLEDGSLEGYNKLILSGGCLYYRNLQQDGSFIPGNSSYTTVDAFGVSTNDDVKCRLLNTTHVIVDSEIQMKNNNYIFTYSTNRTKMSMIGVSNGGNLYLGDYGFSGTKQVANNAFIVATNVYKTTSGGNTSLSDERFKKDFYSIDKAKDFIMQLEPCSYKFTDGTSGRNHLGFKAQQVEQTMLNTIGDTGIVVKYNTDEKEVDLSNPDTYICGLRYEELIAPIVKVVQEQQKEIDELKEQVEELRKLIVTKD